MSVNERINLRAHFARKGAFRPGRMSEVAMSFLADYCYGSTPRALSKSPYQLSRRAVGA